MRHAHTIIPSARIIVHPEVRPTLKSAETLELTGYFIVLSFALEVSKVWGSEMVAANRVAAINPPYRRYGPDTEIQYRPWKPHEPAKPSPKGKPIRNFSIDPTSSIRTQLRTPFLRTPIPRLLQRFLYVRGCEVCQVG